MHHPNCHDLGSELENLGDGLSTSGHAKGIAPLGEVGAGINATGSEIKGGCKQIDDIIVDQSVKAASKPIIKKLQAIEN